MEFYFFFVGLDYFGIGFMYVYFIVSGWVEVISIMDEDVFKVVYFLLRKEGIILVLEIFYVFVVLDVMEYNSSDVIVICFLGWGDKDLEIFINYFDDY